MPLLKRVRSAWKRHGARGLPRLIGKNISYYLGELRSGKLFAKPSDEPSAFDRAYGTETERIHEVGTLDIESENAKHALRYQPSPYEFTEKTIRALPIDYRRFTFLDFGAGKGRVLLIAAALPFEAVIGIELSHMLCDLAGRNIALIAKDKLATGRVECVHGDVTSYPLPESPLVCWFYNPFDAVIMGAVLHRLTASVIASPRDIWVVYAQPDHRDLFERTGYWEVAGESSFHVTYRVRPPQTWTSAGSEHRKPGR
jgi:SAM-dependent methyltransferase